MDLSKCILKTTSCPELGDWAIANKLKVTWGNARRGDIVLYDFNHNGTSDHVGIVSKVASDHIEVVEGNTGPSSNTNGDGVYRRTRYRSEVNYFVRPKISEREAECIARTAETEIGYKEGNNNATKYGKAFGHDNDYWCCVFIWWVFKNCLTNYSAPKIFVKGKTYTVVAESGLNVRKGPGTNYGKVAYVNLSKDGKKHSLSKKHGCFKKGTVVTALEVKGNWVRCPSGWLCGNEGKDYYLK